MAGGDRPRPAAGSDWTAAPGRPTDAENAYANINRNVLLADMPFFAEVLNTGGRVLLSGFYEHDATLLTSRAQELGWKVVNKEVEDDWCMLEFGR